MLTFFGDLENYRIYIYLHLLLTWILCFFLGLNCPNLRRLYADL